MSQLNKGQVIPGNYRIERELGQGGMGAVYEAIELSSGHRFAIKVLHEELRRHPVIPKRFVQEAMAARVLITPHAVKIRTTGALENGIPFIVMEYLDGVDLATAAKRSGGRLAIERALGLLDQAAEALEEAHAKGIVHRDLKPENIFIVHGPQGEFVKVVDFGISKIVTRDEGARLTSTGMTVGTPQYMAPEQLRGVRDLDGRADVYAIGVMLYEILAGVRPFDGFTYEDVILKVVTESPAPLKSYRPDIPQELVAVIERAMSRDRDTRVSSMQELRRLLAPFWVQPNSSNRGASPAGSMNPMERRRVASMAPETTLPMTETTGALLVTKTQNLSASGAYPGPLQTPAPPSALSASGAYPGPVQTSSSASGAYPGPSQTPAAPLALSRSSGNLGPSLSSSGIHPSPPMAIRVDRSTKASSRSMAASAITILIVGLVVTAVVALLVVGGAGAWIYVRSGPASGSSVVPSAGPGSGGARDENVKSIPQKKTK